eukprot:Lithocolla_globosa_v1_NODE_753_length_3331_cov_106.581197.p2 type:complete len:202 gc:universal NODE_753_length_3331_cov_106.581197:1006-1611(+)
MHLAQEDDLRKLLRRKSTGMMPDLLRRFDGVMVDGVDRTDYIHDFFMNIAVHPVDTPGSEDPGCNWTEDLENTNDYLMSIADLYGSPFDGLVSLEETKRCLKLLKKGKKEGFNQIPTDLLLLLPDNILERVITELNKLLRDGEAIFPSTLLVGLISCSETRRQLRGSWGLPSCDSSQLPRQAFREDLSASLLRGSSGNSTR